MYGNDRQKDFFWGAFIGGSLATLSALLFTTKKGKEIQKQIVNAYEGVEDSVKAHWADSKEKLADTAEQTGKKLAHTIHQDGHHKHSK